jgi:hypothetical protein
MFLSELLKENEWAKCGGGGITSGPELWFGLKNGVIIWTEPK